MMINPAKLDLSIRRGADFSISFDILIDGTILDLSGATVKSQIRRSFSRTASLIADFTVTINAETNEITLSLTDTETATLPVVDAAYDVLVSIGEEDAYYLEGAVRIGDSVTIEA
jgi:hypothetical protein